MLCHGCIAVWIYKAIHPKTWKTCRIDGFVSSFSVLLFEQLIELRLRPAYTRRGFHTISLNRTLQAFEMCSQLVQKQSSSMHPTLLQGQPQALNEDVHSTLYPQLSQFTFPQPDQKPFYFSQPSLPPLNVLSSEINGYITSAPPSPLTIDANLCAYNYFLIPGSEELIAREGAKAFTTAGQTALLVASVSTLGMVAFFGSFSVMVYSVSVIAKLIQT